MKPIRRLQHPVSEIMLKKIGDFVVTYALLENQLRSLSFMLTQKNTRMGKLVTDSLSTKSIKAIVATAIKEAKDRELTNEEKNEIKGLLSKFSIFEEERNRLLHSIWGCGKNEHEVCMIKEKATEKGYKPGFKVITTEQLKNTTLEMSRFASLLQDIAILKNGIPF